jgi:hypothetical protein
LNKLFLEFAYSDDADRITFDFGSKMNNNDYSAVVNEINDCRFTSDKIALIESSIRSLADFEDILLDASFAENEIFEVFKLLGIHETAALAKRYNLYSDNKAPDLTEKETILRNRLIKYISLLSPNKKDEIKKLYTQIKQ